MRVLMTGGLGFIGRNLAAYLRRVEKDVTLVALDWFDGASDAEKALFDEVYIGCFAQDDMLALYCQADVVVHLAAYTTVQESIDDPLRSFDNNVVKTQKMLEFLRLNAPGAKVVFASTGGAIIGDYDGAINETVSAKPLSPYGAHKLAVEGLLSAYRGSYGLSSASLRFSNVYGPNSRRKTSVIPAFCKMYFQHNRLKINGDGLQTRDYIYVDDISDAITRVIQQDAQGVFQLGTGKGTSILEIAKIFLSYDPRREVELVHARAMQGEVRHNRADISRAQRELGFVPAYTLNRGIPKTLKWFESQFV